MSYVKIPKYPPNRDLCFFLEGQTCHFIVEVNRKMCLWVQGIYLPSVIVVFLIICKEKNKEERKGEKKNTRGILKL